MSIENGEWIMHGVEEGDPFCIHTVEELIVQIEQIGFLPLFGNEMTGFSVEERTVAKHWWSGEPAKDPWEWRALVARSGRVAYGKFFGGRAGFISKEWLPYFANYRRDGYDFDALWDDEKASIRQKKIMDCFARAEEIYSHELKQIAGFGRGGEKNFDGTVTDLQMHTFLCVRDFQRKKNKKGQEYGWAIAIYCMPEHLWGYEHVTSAYRETPQASEEKIFAHAAQVCPGATPAQMRKVLGITKR